MLALQAGMNGGFAQLLRHRRDLCTIHVGVCGCANRPMRRRSKRAPNLSEQTGKIGQELPANQPAPLQPNYASADYSPSAAQPTQERSPGARGAARANERPVGGT